MKKEFLNKIRWILFDVSGVIVPLILRSPQGYSVGSRHFNPEELEGFYFTKELNQYMLGTLSHEQLIGNYIKKKKLDISVDEFNVVIKTDIVPMEGMNELFETLSKKYKIALATNDGNLISKYKIEKSGVLPYLSKIIASYRIRDLKPHNSFYKKALAIIEARPEECVFIDDTQQNVDAANSLGMRGIVFKNTLQLEKELHILQLL